MFSKFVIQQEAGQIMIHVKNNPQYYINARALTFSENDLGDPNRVAVSLVSGTVVMVHEKETIDYASDGSYEKWTLRGYSTKLVKNDKYYIYTRLSRADKTALIVFSANSYNLDGSITTIIGKDEEGNDITETTDPNENYFYVKIGELTETDGSSMRELTYDSGLLGTDKAKDESDGFSEMWELSKLSTPWLIRAKQWLSSFTVKGFVTLVGGLIFKNGEEEKQVTDIKRSTDSDESVPVNDSTIPTTKYVREANDDRYLRKDQDDRSVGTIASDKGFLVGNEGKGFSVGENGTVTAIIDQLLEIVGIQSKDFSMGEFGNGFVLKYENGKSYLEVDEMLVRRVAYFVELIIKQLSHVGGTLVLSPASMRCSKVEEYEEFYRCYFENERDGKTIKQEFEEGDQARSQTFNVKEGSNHNVSNQYYWRLVIGVGENYIDLSKIDCDSGSLAPLVGDDIVQLGNRYNPERQNAIILSTIGDDAPSFKQYAGINSYVLAGRETTVISPKGNVLTGDFQSKSGVRLEDVIDELGVKLEEVVTQTDQTYTIWFYDYNPSSSNYPTNEWIDTAAKEEHLEDIFYNQDAGIAWRYQKVNGTYQWVLITDHETIKALEKAAEAQQTADSKMQNFVTQPVPPYNIGDRWSNAVYGTQYDNDELVCIKGKAAGESFSISDWRLVSSMSSSDKKHFYSEFERTDESIQSLVADGKTKDEAIAAANAAAKAANDAASAASDAASAAAKTANTANETANTTASALTQTNKSISSIVVAFERNADGSLKLDANGSPKITSAAGSVITNEVAQTYATKTTVDKLSGRVSTAESSITTQAGQIALKASQSSLDALDQRVTTAESSITQNTSNIELKVSKDGVISSINQSSEKVAINASKIDLVGKVTFSMLDSSAQSTINGKATASDIDSKITAYDKTLGFLAKLSAVEKAQLGSTIISGGYIKAELLNVTEIHANEGSIAGFKISSNNLTNEGFSSDAAIIFKNNGNVAAIGSNVIPVESGANGAALFQCHTEDSSRVAKNYAMIVSAAGTGENVAIGIDGGCVEGFAMKNRIINGSGTVALSRVDYNVIVTSTSACTLLLPEMKLCDDGHVVRVKRLGSGTITIQAPMCETFTSGTTGKNYPAIIYDNGSAVGSGNGMSNLPQYDSCEFVWVRDLRVTLGGSTYNGAWIQYKMPKSW